MLLCLPGVKNSMHGSRAGLEGPAWLVVSTEGQQLMNANYHASQQVMRSVTAPAHKPEVALQLIAC